MSALTDRRCNNLSYLAHEHSYMCSIIYQLAFNKITTNKQEAESCKLTSGCSTESCTRLDQNITPQEEN